jgi:hypothetical protein
MLRRLCPEFPLSRFCKSFVVTEKAQLRLTALLNARKTDARIQAGKPDGALTH